MGAHFQKFVPLTFRVVYILRFSFLCTCFSPPESERYQLWYSIFVDIIFIFLYDYKTCLCFALVSTACELVLQWELVILVVFETRTTTAQMS